MNASEDHRTGWRTTSFVIPAYNEEESLHDCLTAIRSACEGIGVDDWEMIVCDNNSTDRTAEIAQSEGARIVYEPYNQISRARNRGAAVASGSYLVFVDADTQVSTALVSRTLQALDTEQVCGGGTEIALAGGKPGILVRGVLAFWKCCSHIFKVAAGSYIFCKREAWQDVGGFSEELYAGEELVFSRALRRWGRSRGMRFCILRNCPVYTSPRKFHWYTPWDFCRQFFVLLRPGALKKRRHCAIWYRRPK